ncbi:MAG: hypothetical protein HKN21_17625 [Candidatus Eisenbacteria bacterium]|uniref:TonB-dependent receptor n=1 Tax=Eiseniibacteriota bacterium TaxID=2212470 RepID=A0A7Y2H403_UNCEI|nr:hypothetical protein [Candidatus Eisenbacteria bacterium]
MAVKSPVGGVLGFGGGARTTGFAEGGFSGRFGSLEVRARGEAIRTEEPKRLPLSQRAAATVHVGQNISGGRWSLEGSGFGREEGAHRVQRNADVFELQPIDGESWGGTFHWSTPGESFGLHQFRLSHQNSRLNIPERLRYRYRETDLGASGSRRAYNGRWHATGNLRWSQARALDGEKNVLSPETRVARQWDNGFYVGLVGALYDADGLLLPVIGYDRKLQHDLRVYVASEPQMKLSSFEDTFFQNGDWNIPALGRKPFRQSLDGRLGFEWRPNPSFDFGMQANWFGGKHFGTWTFEEGLWVETFLDQVQGTVLSGQLAMGSSLRLEIRGERRWVDQGKEPVPFLATQHGEAKLSLGNDLYRLATRWVAVRGRTDHLGESFGDFLRGDVELTYRSRRHLEYSLRIENIANAADRRWPGYPAYGRGVFGGLRWLFGSGG